MLKLELPRVDSFHVTPRRHIRFVISFVQLGFKKDSLIMTLCTNVPTKCDYSLCSNEGDHWQLAHTWTGMHSYKAAFLSDTEEAEDLEQAEPSPGDTPVQPTESDPSVDNIPDEPSASEPSSATTVLNRANPFAAALLLISIVADW